MPVAFPCGFCLNPVAKNHKAVKCDNCSLWIYINCNKTNVQTYNLLINNTVWYCLTWSKKLYPFSALNDNGFHSTIQGKTIKFEAFTTKKADRKCHNRQTQWCSQWIKLTDSSQYFEVDDFSKAFNSSNHKGTNSFHMNMSSLPYNLDQLDTLLSEINISFDVDGITETWLKKQTLTTTNIDINGYNLEHTPTETSCGGSLLYVKNKLSYISQKDVNVYKKNGIESTFIEILTFSGKNIIGRYCTFVPPPPPIVIDDSHEKTRLRALTYP